MKARILDPQVKVFATMDDNTVSIGTLNEGSEIEFSGTKRKAGKIWVPITLPSGQKAFIPGETHIFVVRDGALLQDNVPVYSEPSTTSSFKQQLRRNARVTVLQVVKNNDEPWVKIRDANGSEGYISGETRIRVVQQKSKSVGRKNILTGVMWLIAGVVVVYPNPSPTTGGSLIWLGYIALVFGVGMLVYGIYQYITSPT